MKIDRRGLLKLVGAGAAGTVCLAMKGKGGEPAKAESPSAVDYSACLVDTTLCIGCRKCEEACNSRNKLPRPEKPFSDPSIFRKERRPSEGAFTVVNEYLGRPSSDQLLRSHTYAKVQCMHCLDPACVSACIVGALRKAPDGAVIYRKEICLGCRYCMVACPFQIPAYEYSNPITPRVRKCEFCTDRVKKTGANPACAATCPTEALVFGKRKGLLAMAKERIKGRQDRYVQHIYGENEVGGTSWLYLLGRPQEDIGLLRLPTEPMPRRSEAIQHGIFKYGAFPMLVYGTLGALMWYNNRDKHKSEESVKGKGPMGTEAGHE
jgi:Fe-S-cluster-containing dehydrogenase component